PHGHRHLAPILDGAYGRQDHRAAVGRDRGAGYARRARDRGRFVRRIVWDAGGGISVASYWLLAIGERHRQLARVDASLSSRSVGGGSLRRWGQHHASA